MKTLQILLPLLSAVTILRAAERPNVILIVTDDQGHGEIAAHGNPVIKTPHLDALHAEKTWLKRPGPERLEHGAYYVRVLRIEAGPEAE